MFDYWRVNPRDAPIFSDRSMWSLMVNDYRTWGYIDYSLSQNCGTVPVFDLYDLMLLDRGDGSKPLIDFIALIFYANGGMNIHEYSEYQPRVFNFGDVYQSTRVTQDFMLRGYSFITFRWWSFWSIAVVDLEVQMGWLWKKTGSLFFSVLISWLSVLQTVVRSVCSPLFLSKWTEFWDISDRTAKAIGSGT